MTALLHSISSPATQFDTLPENLSVTETSSVSQATPKRILFVTPRYFPHVGGVPHHVYEVSRRLVRAGIDVTVLTANLGNQLPVQERVEGIQIHRVPAWPANRDYYFAPQIHSVIKRGAWDLVHVQSYHTFFAPLAMLAAWRADVPFVVTFHGGGHSSRLRNALRGVQQLMLRPLLARADRLIAIASFEIPLFSKRLRLPQKQFALIPNGGDLPNITEAEPVQVDEDLIVSVGRLEQYKGHQRAIMALPEILRQRPNARLWIAGTGPYESELRGLARKLGVADRVDIHAIPAAERARMARELSAAALVVLFSEYETHPIAILEALALGRPALVSDRPGLSEIAQRGFVKAIPLSSTPTQTARAIVEQLRQPQKPPKLILPTWDDCAAGLLSVYSSVVTERMSCVS
jgi:glycogen synthase